MRAFDLYRRRRLYHFFNAENVVQLLSRRYNSARILVYYIYIHNNIITAKRIVVTQLENKKYISRILLCQEE